MILFVKILVSWCSGITGDWCPIVYGVCLDKTTLSVPIGVMQQKVVVGLNNLKVTDLFRKVTPYVTQLRTFLSVVNQTQEKKRNHSFPFLLRLIFGGVIIRLFYIYVFFSSDVIMYLWSFFIQSINVFTILIQLK